MCSRALLRQRAGLRGDVHVRPPDLFARRNVARRDQHQRLGARAPVEAHDQARVVARRRGVPVRRVVQVVDQRRHAAAVVHLLGGEAEKARVHGVERNDGALELLRFILANNLAVKERDRPALGNVHARAHAGAALAAVGHVQFAVGAVGIPVVHPRCTK